MRYMSKDPFRNLNTYKIDPLSEIRNAGIVTNGDVFWVSSESDSNHRDRTDALGRGVVKVNLQAAIDAAETDDNDYALVVPTDGGTARPLGTAVDVNEDRLHIVGLGAKPAPQFYNGLAFEGYVAATGIDTELMNITGAGVEVTGIKLLGTSGTAALGTITSLVRVGTAASGTPHDLHFHNNHVENVQSAADNGTAFIINVTGDVATGIQGLRFENNWLGNWAWAPAAVISTGGTAGPTGMEIKGNTLVIDAQAVGDDFIVIGTGVRRYTLLENNKFINVEAGTLAASAVTGAVLVDQPVMSFNDSAVNITAIGTDTEFFAAPTIQGTNTNGRYNPSIARVGTAAGPVS